MLEIGRNGERLLFGWAESPYLKSVHYLGGKLGEGMKHLAGEFSFRDGAGCGSDSGFPEFFFFTR